MRHPQHNEIAEEAKSWFRTPGHKFAVQERRYGFYSRVIDAPEHDSVSVEALTAAEVPDFLEDLRTYYNGQAIKFFIDRREIETAVQERLVSAGCRRTNEWTYLAHVGQAPEANPISDLTIEAVTSKNVLAYQRTKLKGFANSEAEPDAEAIESGLKLRRIEMEGSGRFLIARVGIEAASIIGWHEGAHRLIFHLTTRVPFRGRGVAKHLLSHVIKDTYDQGLRSVLIYTDPEDTPMQLYKRLGFSDEVYWRARYQYDPK